jgi:hypothetical protein
MQPLPGPSAPGALSRPEVSGVEPWRRAATARRAFAETLAAAVEAAGTDDLPAAPDREGPSPEEVRPETPPGGAEALAPLAAAPASPSRPPDPPATDAADSRAPAPVATLGAVRLATWDPPAPRGDAPAAPAASPSDGPASRALAAPAVAPPQHSPTTASLPRPRGEPTPRQQPSTGRRAVRAGGAGTRPRGSRPCARVPRQRAPPPLADSGPRRRPPLPAASVRPAPRRARQPRAGGHPPLPPP